VNDPLVPPQYDGWLFHGSPFPSYHDEEFDEFREYGSAVRRALDGEDDRCDVHGRVLSYQEHKIGACFWCQPWLTPPKRPSKAKATDSSEIDDPEAVQASF
jgi:hypothetical protein